MFGISCLVNRLLNECLMPNNNARRKESARLGNYSHSKAKLYRGGTNALIGVKLFDGVSLSPVATIKTRLVCARITTVP